MLFLEREYLDRRETTFLARDDLKMEIIEFQRREINLSEDTLFYTLKRETVYLWAEYFLLELNI